MVNTSKNINKKFNKNYFDGIDSFVNTNGHFGLL